MTGPDLIKIKNEYANKIRNQAKRGFVTVDVHMGTCGIAAGAQKILDTLNKEMEKLETDNISVRGTGCAGFCSMEPMITVYFPEQPPVKYGNLNTKKALEIFYSHVLGGHVKTDYAISQGLEKPQQR
jgi:NADP-reducing hydrogenase subunit HndB